jgi:hypothetical protein
MLRLQLFLSSYLIALASSAESSSSSIESQLIFSSSATGPITGLSEATVPTGSYLSYSSTITAYDTAGVLGSIASETPSTNVISSSSQILLEGSVATATTGAASSNPSATSTSTPFQPSNETPCNNYPEFCSRKFSNITEVSAHNSPFASIDNLASNQAYPVTTQLDDGIRQLQAQIHFVNNIPHFCHTSCDLLDAGPITTWLTTVYNWVSTHPYDVISIILENGDYKPVTSYVPFIEATGLVNYAYIPPKIPMSIDDWPTLEVMLLTGKRIVFFMDYNANQTAVPWILDQFSQLWETPFDQTNRSFPCNVQRPPNLSPSAAKKSMYMTNHNLNYEISLLGNDILVPYLPLLDATNNVSGFGSLGQGVQDCVQMWNYPPKFLDVDFYNAGGGSVFEVAAKWNGVVYNRPCCGATSKGAGRRRMVGEGMLLLVACGFATLLLM